MKNKGDWYETSSKMIDLSLAISIITLVVNGLKTPFESRRFSGLIKKKKQLDVVYKKTQFKYIDAWDRCSGLLYWDDPKGWDGKGGEGGVQDGEHM